MFLFLGNFRTMCDQATDEDVTIESNNGVHSLLRTTSIANSPKEDYKTITFNKIQFQFAWLYNYIVKKPRKLKLHLGAVHI